MAVAQAAGADPANGGRVALVDASLDASLALLHDNGDVVPGLQELVELHRTARPDPEQVRASLWAYPDRGYDLLPGLRRHRDWTALRPRALEATLTSLRRTYATVVADADADLEGEAETGSLDVEDRNGCARLLTTTADVVVVTGGDGVVGLHRLVRNLAELVGHGVDPERLLPVVNRAPRSPHRRSELARAIAVLLGELAPGTATVSPLMVPHRRDLDAIQLDGSPLPRTFCAPFGAAVTAVLDRVGDTHLGRTTSPSRCRCDPGPSGSEVRRDLVYDHLDTDGLTPLAELEQAVQARAKDIALDMATARRPVHAAGPDRRRARPLGRRRPAGPTELRAHQPDAGRRTGVEEPGRLRPPHRAARRPGRVGDRDQLALRGLRQAPQRPRRVPPRGVPRRRPRQPDLDQAPRRLVHQPSQARRQRGPAGRPARRRRPGSTSSTATWPGADTSW